jgi:hypothetical protein
MRIPRNKNNSSGAERQKLQGRGVDSEYRAGEAENGDQQSSFLNISQPTIQRKIEAVNDFIKRTGYQAARRCAVQETRTRAATLLAHPDVT